MGHYENDCGAAVRSLNGIRDELEMLDLAMMPEHRIRAIKREELAAINSVYPHELYFATLGGDGAALFTGSGPGTRLEAPVSATLDQQFGSPTAWRREFTALARALSDRERCTVRRERGLDAKYIRGGLSAWYAAGGERVLKPQPGA